MRNLLPALTIRTLLAAALSLSLGTGAFAAGTFTLALPKVASKADADGSGTLNISVAPTASLSVQLTSSNTGAFTVPSTVVIPAGKTSVTVPYVIVDNLAVFGTQTATVTAHAAGTTDGTQVVTIFDNKTTDNWSTYGNGQAHLGVYPGSLLGGTYQSAWSVSVGTGLGVNQVAVAKGLVYVTTNDYPSVTSMMAYNTATGAKVWQHDFKAANSINPPTYYKGNVYVQRSNNGGDTELWNLNATTGTVNWSAPFGSQWESYLAPTVHQAIGIWMDGGSYGGLYGFNFNGTQRAFIAEPQCDEWTPTYYNGLIYSWVGTSTTGTFKAVDPATGAVLWSVSKPYTGYSYTMKCAAPIANNVAFLNGLTALTAVNVTTQATIWSITGSFTGTPAVGKSALYVLSGSQVKVLDLATGATKSVLETFDSGLAGQPVLANDCVVASSPDKTYLFNLSSGTLAQTIPYGGAVTIAEGKIYLAGDDGTLRVYRPNLAGFTFASATQPGLSAFGYTATGQNFSATLNYAPVVGAVLTAINNTGTGAITGTFSNLAKGAALQLLYKGVTYDFTANYAGGDGNDLTLTCTAIETQPPVITSGSIPSSVAINTALSYNFVATGFPVPTFKVTAGSLPPGVALTSAGVLSGTPTVAGTYSGTVTATNSAGTATKTFSIEVQTSLMIGLKLPATLSASDPDGSGTLTINAQFPTSVTIQLKSSNTGALTVPASVVIAAGKTSTTVPYTIIDNLAVFGNKAVTVTATASGWTAGSTIVTVLDNKTTDNWSTYGNGPAHTGVYPGALLGGTFQQVWSTTFSSGSAALNPVAVAKGIAYVTPISRFGIADLTAVDAVTGAPVWKFVYSATSNSSLNNVYNSINPPTVYKGNVYVQQGQGLGSGGSGTVAPKLWSFNSATGKLNWTAGFSAQWESYLAPLVHQSIGIWTDAGSYGGLYGYNFDGSAKGYVAQNQYDEWTPTLYNGTIYTWVGGNTSGVPGTFTAVNPATSSVLWSVKATYNWHGWSMDCAVPIANDLAYLNGSTALTAVNVTTHAIPWTIAGTFTGTPAIASGKVYVISGSQVKILNAATGATVGNLETLDTGLVGQPVVSTDALIVSSSTKTYIFSLAAGTLAQTIAYGGPVSVAGGHLYIAGSDGTLRDFRSNLATINLASSTAVGTTSAGYNATGQTLKLNLGFIPQAGTTLTVINNTGTQPIKGVFTGLANGGTLVLASNGTTYSFVANYAGGDGNDLTLTLSTKVPLISSANLATFDTGQAGTFKVVASGTPTPTYSATGLPSWAKLNATTGVLSGTPPDTTGSPFAIKLTATSGTASIIQTFSLKVQTVIIPTTFSQWQTKYGVTTGAAAIPQYDGVPNLLKYAFHLVPTHPITTTDRASLPVPSLIAKGASEYLTLTYRQFGSLSGTTIGVQSSTDLQTWKSVTPDYNVKVSTDPVSGDIVKQVGLNVTGLNSGKFIRLSVTGGGATVYTNPESFLGYDLPASGTAISTSYLSIPLTNEAVYVGQVSSLTTNTVTVATSPTPWISGALATAATPYYVKFLSGVETGRVLKVTANTTNRLTLDVTDGTAQTVALSTTGFAVKAGDAFEVFSGDTLANLFGDATSANPLVFSGGTGNTVSLYNGSTKAWQAYYFDTASHFWKLTGSTANANTVTIPPTAAIRIIRPAGEPAASFALVGRVTEVNQLTKTPGSSALVYGSTGYALNLTLSQIQFGTNWVRNALVTKADNLAIWNSQLNRFDTYYQVPDTSWRSSTDATVDQSDVVIPTGSVITLLKRSSVSGVSSYLSSTLPYPQD